MNGQGKEGGAGRLTELGRKGGREKKERERNGRKTETFPPLFPRTGELSAAFFLLFLFFSVASSLFNCREKKEEENLFRPPPFFRNKSEPEKSNFSRLSKLVRSKTDLCGQSRQKAFWVASLLSLLLLLPSPSSFPPPSMNIF